MRLRPARRTFYTLLGLAARIRDLGSAEKLIGTIDELVDRLTHVTGASWNEVKALLVHEPPGRRRSRRRRRRRARARGKPLPRCSQALALCSGNEFPGRPDGPLVASYVHA